MSTVSEQVGSPPTSGAEDLVAQLVAERDQARAANAELHHALDTARTIGAAVGIVMVRLGLTESEAFEVVRHVSQTRHRKVREVAADVVASGQVPGRTPR